MGFEGEVKHKKTVVEHALWIRQWQVLRVLPGIPVSTELMVLSVSSDRDLRGVRWNKTITGTHGRWA